MTDSKMPDRITAWPWEVNPHMGQWETAQSIVGEGQPYLALHGETLAEVRAALTEAAWIIHKAYVAATMEAVNAGPSHPLAAQMDKWRSRCAKAEEASRAALAVLAVLVPLAQRAFPAVAIEQEWRAALETARALIKQGEKT